MKKKITIAFLLVIILPGYCLSRDNDDFIFLILDKMANVCWRSDFDVKVTPSALVWENFSSKHKSWEQHFSGESHFIETNTHHYRGNFIHINNAYKVILENKKRDDRGISSEVLYASDGSIFLIHAIGSRSARIENVDFPALFLMPSEMFGSLMMGPYKGFPGHYSMGEKFRISLSEVVDKFSAISPGFIEVDDENVFIIGHDLADGCVIFAISYVGSDFSVDEFHIKGYLAAGSIHDEDLVVSDLRNRFIEYSIYFDDSKAEDGVIEYLPGRIKVKFFEDINNIKTINEERNFQYLYTYDVKFANQRFVLCDDTGSVGVKLDDDVVVMDNISGLRYRVGEPLDNLIKEVRSIVK